MVTVGYWRARSVREWEWRAESLETKGLYPYRHFFHRICQAVDGGEEGILGRADDAVVTQDRARRRTSAADGEPVDVVNPQFVGLEEVTHSVSSDPLGNLTMLLPCQCPFLRTWHHPDKTTVFEIFGLGDTYNNKYRNTTVDTVRRRLICRKIRTHPHPRNINISIQVLPSGL